MASPQRRKPNQHRSLKDRKGVITPRNDVWYAGYVSGSSGAGWKCVPHKHGQSKWHIWLEGWRAGRHAWHDNGRKSLGLKEKT